MVHRGVRSTLIIFVERTQFEVLVCHIRSTVVTMIQGGNSLKTRNKHYPNIYILKVFTTSFLIVMEDLCQIYYCEVIKFTMSDQSERLTYDLLLQKIFLFIKPKTFMSLILITNSHKMSRNVYSPKSILN